MSLQSLLPAQIQTASGMQDTATVLDGKKAVALYFSAHWCPPCRGFTPVAAAWYELAKSNSAFEIIFISADEDAAAFAGYFAEMPWKAVAFEGTNDVRDALNSKFGISGIPALVVVNPADCSVIDQNGRATVTANKADPAACFAKWGC